MSFRNAIVAEGGAVAFSTGPLGSERVLSALLVHLSAAPTTSELLTLTLDSVDGAEHDAVLYSKDLATVTDIALTDIRLPLLTGDALKVAYTNTDQRTIGIRVVLT